MPSFELIRDRASKVSFTDPSKFTRAQKFIEQNKKKLEDSSVFFNPDTTFIPVEDFHEANLRVLIVFGSPASVKAVSSTAAALNSFVKEICNQPRTKEQNTIPQVPHAKQVPEGNARESLKVFMDFTYVPNGSDMKVFDKNNMPYAIGNITHLDASYFDVVGFSISVLSEVITCPNIIKSFSRCDSPIPLTWSERKGEVLGRYPLIYAGGITAACSDIMFGDLGDGRQAFVDYLYLGSCEKMDIMWERHIEALEHNEGIRAMAVPEGELIPPFPPLYKHNGVDIQGPISNQDYINSIFDMPMIYQPQAYKVVFDNRNRVIENTKINQYAQDFVKPYYPLEIDEDCLGIGMTVIQASGDNVGTSQIQVSEGCSAAGACSFSQARGTRIWTNGGIKRIEDIVGTNPYVQAIEAEKCQNILQTETAEVFRITLNSGHYSRGDRNHKFMVFENGNLVERRLMDLKKGDVVFRKLGSDFIYLYKKDDCGNTFDEKKAELLGFMHGDGAFHKGEFKNHNKMWQLYTREGEGYYVELFKELCGFDKEPTLIYDSEKTEGVKVFLSCKSVDIKKFYNDDLCLTTCDKLRVPEIIFKSPQSVMRAYLRGVFQADGWSNDDCIGLTSISKQFVDDIAILLSFLGYDCSILKNRYFDRNPNEGHKVSYQVTIRKYFLEKFRKEVGFEYKQIESDSVSNWCKATMPKTDELVRLFRSVVSSRQELRDAGLGSLYDWTRKDRDNNISINLLRKFKEIYPDVELPFFYEKVANSELVPDVISEIESEGIEEEMYDVLNTETHLCVYGTILTHQCAEGNYTGGWTEKSRDRILWEARESKKYSAGYKMKPFSFNILPIDTYVACGEGRFTQLGNIEKSRTVLTYEGEKSTIAGFLKDTKDRYFRFKLSRGMDARMSLKHKQMVLTEDGLIWKEADELKVGDWIPQNIGYYSEYLKDYQFSEMDYFLGLWFGDGHRQQPEWKRSVQCFNANEKDLIEFCRNSDAFRIKSDKIREGVYDWVYEDEYNEYFKTIFPNYKYGENNLHVLNISQLLSFIKGWFDADGDSSLSKNNVGKTDVGSRFKVTFAEKSMNVARLVGAVLNSIGINFHLSPTVEVKLDGYDKVHKRRDLTITGLKSRQLFLKYIGFTQSAKLEKIRDSKTTWSDKDKTLPGLFGKYLYSELKKLGKTKGFNTSKFFNGIKGITEDRFEEKFSNIDCEPVRLFNKGIRFSQIEKIEVVDDTIECADINEPKTNQFITEFGITHNCNYVTDYKGLLWEFMKIYPKVTFINMRMEELGRDVDALRMMKLVGSNRISAPMEGISPRIQNNLLNKCLSEESLTNFMDDMVHARLTDIKVGGIFTGYEEDEDFQWICDFVDRYKQRAAMENGNFPFRLKVTPLVHYNLTPIEYIERKSAKKSYEGEHWLSDEWYEKFHEHNVFFKVNGFRYSTFIEQSIIDLGRSATKWMYDNIVSQNLPVYSLRSFATEEIVNNLKKIVNKDWFFEARNPEHYISISHRIHIDLMGSYIPRARRLVRLYEQGKILENPMDIRCLKTFEGAQTKCYSACVSKDPLKIYKDVKLDENDNLIGEFRELKGCERCPDKKHKMDRLARPTPQTKNSEDIISLPKLKPIQKVRFVLKRTDEYCVLNPNNTAHTFVAKFLQESEELVDMYYGVGGHNFFWQSDADIPYEVSGFQVVDVLFTSSKAFSIIDGLADKVSKSLKSVKIISYKKEFVEDQIKVNDYNVFRFETTLPYDLFQSACVSYKGDIRVKKDVLLETITDKSLKKPAFISIGKTVGYFVLPCKYNPYLYIQGLLMDKRIPLTKLRQEMNIENVLIVRDSMNICNCGKEKGFVSMVTGKQMKFGLNCLPAALLKVELNRKK